MQSLKIPRYYPKGVEQVKKHSFRTKSTRSLQEHRRSMILVPCWLHGLHSSALSWKLFWSHVQLPLPQPPVWAYRFSLEGTDCGHSLPPLSPVLSRRGSVSGSYNQAKLFLLSPTQPPPIEQKFYRRRSRPRVLRTRSPSPSWRRFHVRRGK